MGSCLTKESEPKLEIKSESKLEIKSESESKHWSNLMQNIDENIPKWTCKDLTEYVKVVKVVDGDTIDIARLMGEKVFQFRVRLYGIDTPEKRPPLSQTNRQEEITASIVSSNALKTILENAKWLIRIDFIGEDKYGRLLGNIFIEEKDEWINLNEWMIKNNYAKPYFGGTKKQFE